MSADRERVLMRAAAKRLALPESYIADVLHYEPSDHDVWCDRLRVMTFDLLGDWSYVDWRPTGPPSAGTRGWPPGKDRRCAKALPSLPFGMATLLGSSDTGRIPVVEGLTDWLCATWMRGPERATVGAGGLGAMRGTVERLVAFGVPAERLVVIFDHDPADKVSTRKQAAGIVRWAREHHPELSFLRPEREGCDIADGWRLWRGAWAEALDCAIEVAEPGGGVIPAPTDAASVTPITEAA